MKIPKLNLMRLMRLTPPRFAIYHIKFRIIQLCLKSARATQSPGKPRRAVSVTHGAESAGRRIMWSILFFFMYYLNRNFVKGDLLTRALDAEKGVKEMFSVVNDTFCAKMSNLEENFLYQVSDGTEVVRSVVSSAGKLVNCSATVNKIQVNSFMHECWLGLKEQRAARELQTVFAHMDKAKLMCREFKARSERSGSVEMDERDDSALQHKVLERSKRGFTYPGTLWCGAGNMADHYDQLGSAAETDSCCRTHDHCPHVIHAFSSSYGYTNFKWHSISHCDCDDELKACLRKVNDTTSRVVGQAFFNIFSVPCFELVYEDQCKERHWYGLCKQYEKFPIAVMKEAVPYGFRGIDVIDELTVAPPKNKHSKKSKEEEKPESTTLSTMSGTEEPSLTNVVTAAEDFIKFLATVSTSQGSSPDSDKGETQSSEKKKRKNTGKKRKTTNKQKGKGKGRRRKQKAEAGVKVEEGAAVSPSGNRAEEVIALSNFINESQKLDQSGRNTNRMGDSEYELGEKEQPSNEVMKDEPAMDKETVSITSPPTVQKKPAESHIDMLIEENTSCTSASVTTVIPQKDKNKRLRKGRRMNRKIIPLPPSKELVANTTDILSTMSTFTIITPASQPKQQSLGNDTEEQPVVSVNAKRNRSKERKDGKGRKKNRKVSLVSLSVAAGHEDPPASDLKVIPLSATVPSALGPEWQVSHRPGVYLGNMTAHIRALNSSFAVLKRQRLNERGLRNKRTKTVLPLSGENPLFHNSSKNVLPIPTTTDGSVITAAISGPMEQLETHRKRRRFTTAAPTISTKQHRKQRKPRKKAMPLPLRDGAQVPLQTVTSNTATTEEPSLQKSEISEMQHMTTSATLVMSPVQFSNEKARAQFSRKKKKATVRRQ
uniref:phospholipase A2 n=1 Tax=Monopterus albus TaxID=43700 RepID=A0A3Q3JUX3_MONAL|nr:protein PROCA1 [Monopterus albus]